MLAQTLLISQQGKHGRKRQLNYSRRASRCATERQLITVPDRCVSSNSQVPPCSHDIFFVYFIAMAVLVRRAVTRVHRLPPRHPCDFED